MKQNTAPKKAKIKKIPVCAVPNCTELAAFEVLLYDKYSHGEIFLEQDITCPYLCSTHQIENEEQASGVKRPRGIVVYPYTNQHRAQGYTQYRDLSNPSLII